MLKYASIPKSVTLLLKIEPFSILEKQREENVADVDCKTDLQYVTHSALKNASNFLQPMLRTPIHNRLREAPARLICYFPYKNK